MESQLGDLISNVLGERLGESQIHEALPAEVSKRLRNGNNRHDYAQATFNDLIIILFGNWSLFADLFGSETKKPVREPLDQINNGVRRYLAHPHRANTKGYTIGQRDLDLLEKMWKWVNSADSKWKARPQN